MSAAPDDPDDNVVNLGTKRRSRRPPPGQHVWSDHLIWGRGGPRDCVANVAIVLREDPIFVGRFSYNLFCQRTVVDDVPWHSTNHPRDWVDRDDIALAEWCQLHGLLAKPGTCAQAVETVAHEYEIHPLRNRLAALEWDGAPRLSSWLTDYLGVPSRDYSEAVGRKWMISAVARAFVPGCKADHALILEGPQGVGKSTACAILALEPDWFTDEIADLGTKDSAQNLPGKWLIELGELSAMKRGEVERIKGFIVRSTDHYRPSYGRRSQDFPRGCVFIGSTNAHEYLADTTGNRRWWPVAVGRIDLDGLRQNVEQLWAEAVAAYRASEEWWLDIETEKVAAEEQAERQQVDPWHDLVLDAANRIHKGLPFMKRDVRGYVESETVPKTVTTNAILQVINVSIERRDRSAATRVGSILAAAGWRRKRKRVGGDLAWFYEPPIPPW